MKRTVTTLALAAILAGTSHAAINGKKPAFMDKQQLAAMRAGAASNAIKETEDPAFFTGKPYLASTDTYLFRYRSYAPNVARWTSEDPSGFPDGANHNIYLNNSVTNGFDPDGLRRREVDTRSIIPTNTGWQSAGYDYPMFGNNYHRTAYQTRVVYAQTWTETTIGRTTDYGESLTGSSTIGLSQTSTVSISATGWSMTLGGSYAQSGSHSSTLPYQRPATDGVAWEAYVLTISGTVEYQVRNETKDSNGNWVPVPFSPNPGHWSNPGVLGSGLTSTFGLTVYKVYE